MTQEQAMIFAINRFLYCGMNYTPRLYKFRNGRVEWIPSVILNAEGWTCDLDHICSKWLEAVEHAADSHAYFIRFAKELNATNREVFFRSVIKNFDDEQKLSFDPRHAKRTE